ncbi:NACHT domain-containing protein [Streptomyces sp. NPDC060031]|uniref:NACHT domain-containing protein n=1 Tax=Streptomyces sp. NPDC060031 TaxID=3347043 RepID=UPI0036AF8B92
MDHLDFEEEVRTVARALWASARDDGTVNLDGVEHDGVYFTHDVVHCVEVTVSRRKDKAEHDGKKLSKAVQRWTGSDGRIARGWFVTLEEPSPEQTKVLQAIDRRITAISFKRFKARLFDAYLYNQRRGQMPFGSAMHPDGRGEKLERYIPAEFEPIGERADLAPAPSFSELIERIGAGGRFCIVGDYGIGKSMTLREIYLRISQAHREGKTLRHPVHLNLRDLWGQRSPRVALTQHAEDLGYGQPDQIIAAWRAGYVDILLDGFDEIAAPGWSSDIVELRHSRRKAVELVRNFYDQTPQRASVVVVGRRSYFDGLSELNNALFNDEPCTLLELSEFNDAQLETYLQDKRWASLPDWIPKRPLLIGYLASRKLLGGLLEPAQGVGPAEGWDWLLDQISKREARIETGLDGQTIRLTIERLASVARKSPSCLGPLTYSEITEGFRFVRGREPSDDQRTILHRLPGLGSDPDFEEGTRKFIDVDLASAAQAKDVSNFIMNPFAVDLPTARSWSGSLLQSGVEVAALQCGEAAVANEGAISTALSFAQRNDLDVLSADVVRIALARGISVVGSSFNVDEVVVPQFELYEDFGDLSGISFSRCGIETLVLDGEIDGSLMPRFQDCFFETIIGRFGEEDLPANAFASCAFGEFLDSADRNADVLRSSLPEGVRVMITILRKLYLQRGSGRAEGALVRGMEQASRALVPGCLDIIKRENLAAPIRLNGRTVWLPSRSDQKRVHAFIAAPRGSGDPLFGMAGRLS